MNENSSAFYQNRPLDSAEFSEILAQKCQDFKFSDPPIYRYIDDQSKDIIYVKLTGERRSAYTYNHYSLMLNNFPQWQDFPKRNVICGNFKWINSAYRLIPLDGTIFGVVPSSDIQMESVLKNSDLKNIVANLSELSGFYEQNSVPDNSYLEMLSSLQKKLQEYDGSWDFRKLFDINYLQQELDPAKLGFKHYTYPELVQNMPKVDRELWFDKDYLLYRE